MADESPEPDWLTDMDKEILEVLSSELILTPAIIAENIGRSRKGVSNRLNSLQAGELVEKVDRGKYRITSDGELVWKSIDGLQYSSRRIRVAQEKAINWKLGVSKEEYEDMVKEEYNKLREKEIEPEGDKDLYDLAFERAEDRLKDEE
ncbi:hypothetical protein [Halorhabdus sp. CUG00001]|uniref:hypothetical protein n=1 Tax=Halorhabdus sp. CUG00001 TaxID=2600297 RepID=UPI0018EF2A05|nr:hypothetical protein [Halorhabdus sp. CUG00001]